MFYYFNGDVTLLESNLAVTIQYAINAAATAA